MREENLINALDEIIYVSDLESYDILYANDFCKRAMIQPDYNGYKCYQLITCKQEPCDFCTNSRLRFDRFYVWEFTNPVSGRHYLLKDKLIQWEGKPARLEIAMDITEQEDLSQQVRQKLKTEQTIVNCIRLLTEAGALDQAIQAVLSGIGEYYQADRAYILELDEERKIGDNTYEWCAPGVPRQIQFNHKIPLSQMPLWDQAIRGQSPVRIPRTEDLRRQYPTEYRRMTAQGIDALLAAPFLIGERSLGYIGVDNPAYQFDDPSLLQSLSYFIINELQKRRMQAELEHQNSHDALTGLLNRSQYLRYLDSPRASGLRMAGVVFCDMNGLKQINDAGGHSAGDQAIIRTARILEQSFPTQQIYRLSGDEFVVLCENVGKADFDALVDRARVRFRGERNRGVSIGSVWAEGAFDLRQMVRSADERMYLEKQEYYAR